jgi:hypothetical protein
MDKILRFSDYDVFGYLASGLALLVAWDLALGTNLVLGSQWSVADAALAIAGGYVVGHIVATFSSEFIEIRLVRGWLGAPSVVLLAEGPPTSGLRGWLARTVLAEYFRPLGARMRALVHARALADGCEAASGEALFAAAYGPATRDPATFARMEAFLKLYGFARNLAFVCLVATPVLLVAAAWVAITPGGRTGIETLGHAVLAALIGIGMLHRYLKFYRRFSTVVLGAYAETPAPEKEANT